MEFYEVLTKRDRFFTENNRFKHHIFGDYLVSNYNIRRQDGQLFIKIHNEYQAGREIFEHVMVRELPELNKQRRAEVWAYLNLVPIEEFPPADRTTIFFENGQLKLPQMLFFNNKNDVIPVNKLQIKYSPLLYNEIVEQFLNDISCGDVSLRKVLEEVAGMCLYRGMEYSRAVFLIGNRCNGKSTFLELVRAMLGDKNVSSMDLCELQEKFSNAELHNKLANIGDDIGDEYIPNTSIFKKLVTGETIQVQRKGSDPFDMRSYATLLFAANELPKIKDTTGAVQRRLLIIPFNADFSDSIDIKMRDKLLRDECVEYFCSLAVCGLKRVFDNGKFTDCEAVNNELKRYHNDNRSIELRFLESLDDICGRYSDSVYNDYVDFCRVNQARPISKIQFSREVCSIKNVRTTPRKGGRVYTSYTSK